jgi:hypothetical protein
MNLAWSHEVVLATEQKDFKDSHASVFAHELVVDVREGTLDTRAVEVADRERRLAEQQMQELAAAQIRLEDLQAICVGEAQKVWDFMGSAESALVPFCFCPSGPGSRRKKLALSSRCLILLAPKCWSWKMSSPVGCRRRWLRST